MTQIRLRFLGSGDAFGSGGRFGCEAYFFEKKVKYHLDYRTLLDQRERLECRRLILTHMSQDMLNRASEVEVNCAEDRLVIVL